MILCFHSTTHLDDQQQEDGLNIEYMAKSYGGKQWKLHSLLMKEEIGYLGNFWQRKLQPGDAQSFVFTADDEGPFWMTREKQVEKGTTGLLKDNSLQRDTSKQNLQKNTEKNIIIPGNMKKH